MRHFNLTPLMGRFLIKVIDICKKTKYFGDNIKIFDLITNICYHLFS